MDKSVAERDGRALVAQVVEAVEAWLQRHELPGAAVDEAAGFVRQYWGKVRDRVRSDPSYRMDVVTLARLAAVAGYRVVLVPDELPEVTGDTLVADLDLSRRARVVLAGIETVRDLEGHTAEALLQIRGVGPACVREVERCLGLYGRRLAGAPC